MNIITKGLGNDHRIVTQGYGGLFYLLKGWVTVFKKELKDWADKKEPVIPIERPIPVTVFDAKSRIIGFTASQRVREFIRNTQTNLVEKLKMSTGILHKGIFRIFDKIAPIATVDKLKPIYGVEHPGTNTNVNCSVRSRVFDEAHKYFETPQL
jgi:hypothetical protein